MSDPDRLAWRLACYHEAENDIRWAKERASSVVNWSVLLLGAIAAASDDFRERGLLLGFGLILGGVAIFWLWDLHRFAAKARNRVHGEKQHKDGPVVLRLLPTKEEMPEVYPVTREKGRDHPGHLIAQVAVVVVALLFALAYVWTEPRGG